MNNKSKTITIDRTRIYMEKRERHTVLVGFDASEDGENAAVWLHITPAGRRKLMQALVDMEHA